MESRWHEKKKGKSKMQCRSGKPVAEGSWHTICNGGGKNSFNRWAEPSNMQELKKEKKRERDGVLLLSRPFGQRVSMHAEQAREGRWTAGRDGKKGRKNDRGRGLSLEFLFPPLSPSISIPSCREEVKM
jgi:hypothetical protein